MENHSFSKPRIVKDARVNPTWSVDVIRNGVTVATLFVNKENFPPRKKKNKIRWKLPDDDQVLPKFGENERLRLYEMFKEQKKERRKKLKNDDENICTGNSQQVFSESHDDSDSNAVDGIDHETNGGTSPATEDDTNNPNPAHAAPSTTNIHAPTTESAYQSPQPPPPPGFSSSILTSQSTNSTSSNILPQAPPVHGHQRRFFPQPHFNPSYVVDVFLICMNQGRSSEWIPFYAPHGCNTLLVGSAQGQAQDRALQWQSLSSGGSWQCQNFHAQNIDSASAQVLLTVNGQTQQREQSFSYNLTWILHVEKDNLPAGQEAGYQIRSEVLSLFLN